MTRTPVQLDRGPAGAPLDRFVAGPLVWTADTLAPEDCVITLDANEAAALESAVDRPGPLMARVKQQITRGPGVAVVRSLPVDALGGDAATALFWDLGRRIGRPVAQKWDGTRVYHVRDTGQGYGQGVRGSYTNVELVFHNDNAFGRAPPDAVGLLCLRSAKSGGVSRFCSLYAVHNHLLKHEPRLLARLYRPFLWDRQGEHGPRAAKLALGAMLRFDSRRLLGRVNVSLARKGYALAGQAMDAETEDALAALEAVCQRPDMWLELPLARGHLQYLNNREILHYRSGFVDHDEPALKRHLVRSWHRDRGRPDYDG